MEKFPTKKYVSFSSFSNDYFKEKQKVIEKLNLEKLNKISETLIECYKSKKNVFTCGNGGSASISNHFVCDHIKGVQTNTDLYPKIISLSNNFELITAIANDISYENIFSYQLNSLSAEKDVLFVISSSGNSSNVVKAIEFAKSKKLKTLSLTGFDGGKVKKMSDLNLNVDCSNYGIVEDVHQSIMHILAQFIRNYFMKENEIIDKLF